MLRNKEPKLKNNGACSFSNGIMINSKRHKGYIAVSNINEDGIITTKWLRRKEYEKNKSKEEKKKHFTNYLLLTLPVAIIYLVYAFFLIYKNELQIFYKSYFIFMSVFTLYVFFCSVITDKTKYKGFHSSEHMVLNAYKKLGHVPTLDEIKRFSRFSKYCGTNMTTLYFLFYTTAAVAIHNENILVGCCVIIGAFVAILVLWQLNCLNFLQRFTTVSPTDTELLLAIDCMRCWEENEKKPKEKSLFFRFLQKLSPKKFCKGKA